MKTLIERVQGEVLASELEFIIEEYLPKLRSLSTEDLYYKTSQSTWSKIETIGSLVDATHNCIQHIMLARLGAKPKTYYSKEAWVRSIDYQTYDKNSLLDLFGVLNHQLVWILKGVEPNDFYKACNSAMKGTYHRCLKDIVRIHIDELKFNLSAVCTVQGSTSTGHLKMVLR